MSTGVITLITGVPGAGKSLRGVAMLLDGVKAGLRCFSVGIEWQKECGVSALADITQWGDANVVPDGSMVLVDEADMEGRFPQRDASKRVPEYVAELKRVRHRGIQLIVVTQHPKQIDIACRRLVGRHLHLERLFGFNGAQVFEWNKIQERVDDRGARYGAVKSQWAYDKALFEVYKSASVHTIAPKMPWKIWILPVLVLVMALMIWAGVAALDSLVSGDDGASVEAAGSVPGVPVKAASAESGTDRSLFRPASMAGRGGGENRQFLTVDDYIAAHIPRIPSQPWSAPIFDAREPVSEPELFCVASEESRCVCHTEQGTRYQLAVRECLAVVRNGVYNPYRKKSVPVVSSGSSSAGARVSSEFSSLPLPAKPPPLNRSPSQDMNPFH